MASISLGSYVLKFERKKKRSHRTNVDAFKVSGDGPFKLHLGPGPNWQKPDDKWISVDVDPARGDIAIDFNVAFKQFPLSDNSVSCIYASHTFEHISIHKMPRVMRECHRILTPGGFLRIIVPNPARSIREYLAGNAEFPLFRRRIERAKKRGQDYTLFHALREDFLSPASQSGLLGKGALAHQNAWDFDAMRSELVAAGFCFERVSKKDFQDSTCADFAFEGTYHSEANAQYRSLYVEAQK